MSGVLTRIFEGAFFPAFIPGFKWFLGFLGLIYLIFKNLQTRVVQNHFASPIRLRKMRGFVNV